MLSKNGPTKTCGEMLVNRLSKWSSWRLTFSHSTQPELYLQPRVHNGTFPLYTLVTTYTKDENYHRNINQAVSVTAGD